jgi:hypothetical protein
MASNAKIPADIKKIYDTFAVATNPLHALEAILSSSPKACLS